jgi:hypothetical protein
MKTASPQTGSPKGPGKMYRRTRKIRARLGEKEWLRPEGMHQKTFGRLRAKLIEAKMMADEMWCKGTSARLERVRLR